MNSRPLRPFKSSKRKAISYNFSKNSQTEHEINTPPGTPRSRSFTRLTMRVGLPHFGQSVLFEVSISFLRSAVFAILAIIYLLAKILPQAAGLDEMNPDKNSGVVSKGWEFVLAALDFT